MSTRPVYLVRCDRCPDSEFTPFSGRTHTEARKAAKDNGWKRIRVAAEIGIPAHLDDVCPSCTTNAEDR